jgi:hypothetical protein
MDLANLFNKTVKYIEENGLKDIKMVKERKYFQIILQHMEFGKMEKGLIYIEINEKSESFTSKLILLKYVLLDLKIII